MDESKLNEVFNLEVTNKELRTIPELHLGFLISSCLAATELNILLKPLLMSLNSRKKDFAPDDKCLQEVAFAHEVIFQRNLAAKLYEYIYSLGAYQNKCTKSSDTTMSDFFLFLKQDIKEIKNSKEYSTLKWFRDKATSHYASSEFTKLVKNINVEADDMPHPFYLHMMQGNSYYLLGEQILLQKFSETTADPYKVINDYSNWIRKVNGLVQKIHSEFCIQLLKIYFPEKALTKIQIKPDQHHVGNLTKTNMPLLWNFP